MAKAEFNLLMLKDFETKKNGLKLKKDGIYNVLNPTNSMLVENGYARPLTEKEVVHIERQIKKELKNK